MTNSASSWISLGALGDIYPDLAMQTLLLALIGKIVSTIIVLIIMFLCISLSRKAIKKLIHKPGNKLSERKVETITTILTSFTKYAIYFIGSCQILTIFGMSMQSILAVAGIGSVAIGFGAQSLVKDFIQGLFILMEDQFGVGDDVDIDGKIGKVEAIGMRTTRLRSPEDSLIIIPNSTINTVINKNL